MKVSIIIPIYNVEKYIFDCLRSVADQTMTEGVECILVDDKGNDNSMSIAQQFVDDYYGGIQFTILHHEKNKGLSAARNTGIDAAVGKYLYFLDSDDELTPECIERLYALATKYDVDMVQGCYIADCPMLTSFWKSKPAFTSDRSYIMRTMLNYDIFPIMAQNRLVLRDIIVNNNLYFKEGIIHEDNHWTFFLSKHIKSLAICNTPTYSYRSTPGSIMNNRNQEKESIAFECLVEDLSRNIDNFEKGAQKRYVFLNILIMWRDKYYSSKRKASELMKLFERNNSIFERLVFRCCLHLNFSSYLNSKMINLLQRLYLS